MCSRMRGVAGRLVAFSAALAPLGAAPAAAAPRPCELQVAVTPSPLPAGQRSARVRVTPAPAALQLAASQGELGEARREGSRSMVADWTPPRGTLPATALVAAVGGGECGYAVVRSAGPLDASGRGGATLVVLDQTSVRADRYEEVAVYVFATDEVGIPRRGPAPLVTASIGRTVRTEAPGPFAGRVQVRMTVRTEALGPGVWRGTWQVPAGEAGPAAVAAQFAGEPSVSIALARTAGPPAEAVIEFGRPRAVPGDPAPVRVDVRLRDGLGNPTDAPVEVGSDVGEVGAPERVETGLYRAPLVVPSSLRGGRAVLVIAKTGGVIATAPLQVGPGPAAAIRVAPPGPIPGDGATTAHFEATVTDAFDNPAEEIPEGESPLGSFAPSSRLAPGRWVMGFRPIRVLKDTPITLTVKAGPAVEEVKVEILASRVSFAVGPKVGPALATGRTGLAVGLEASAWTQVGKQQLGLVLEGTWLAFSGQETIDVGGSAIVYDSGQSWVPVLLSVAWRVPLGRHTMLWASAGGGLAFVANQSQIQGQPEVSETGVAPAASLAASFVMYAWRGFPFVELRATWVGSPNMTTLTGSIVPAFVLVGYRFDAS